MERNLQEHNSIKDKDLEIDDTEGYTPAVR
jgi:hypothetical protein